MKFVRFMGQNEFNKLVNGETLKMNDRQRFCESGAKTLSSGFCFLGSPILYMDKDENIHQCTPFEALEFLYGIVTTDVLVEFEAEPDVLQRSYGIYSDPDPFAGFSDTVIVAEFCTTEYSRKKIKPIRVCYDIDVFGSSDGWKAL